MNTATVVGYVYLIREGDIHKIGKSKDPDRRLGQVAVDGVVVHVIPSANPFHIESALHRRFAEQRCTDTTRGREWFHLTEDDVEAICRLGTTHTVDDLPPELQPIPSPQKSKRYGVPLHVWTDQELAGAFQDYLSDTEPSVAKTAAVEAALRDFLCSKGYWPRKKRILNDESPITQSQ